MRSLVHKALQFPQCKFFFCLRQKERPEMVCGSAMDAVQSFKLTFLVFIVLSNGKINDLIESLKVSHV